MSTTVIKTGMLGKDTFFVPEKRTEEYYKKRPCEELVASAARCLELYMGK